MNINKINVHVQEVFLLTACPENNDFSIFISLMQKMCFTEILSYYSTLYKLYCGFSIKQLKSLLQILLILIQMLTDSCIKYECQYAQHFKPYSIFRCHMQCEVAWGVISHFKAEWEVKAIPPHRDSNLTSADSLDSLWDQEVNETAVTSEGTKQRDQLYLAIFTLDPCFSIPTMSNDISKPLTKEPKVYLFRQDACGCIQKQKNAINTKGHLTLIHVLRNELNDICEVHMMTSIWNCIK